MGRPKSAAALDLKNAVSNYPDICIRFRQIRERFQVSQAEKQYLVISMRLLALLLITLFLSAFMHVNNPGKGNYRCLPCGSDCDEQAYDEKGSCAHCGMPLVLTSTIKFRQVSPTDICTYIANHPRTILLDVRSKEEFEGTVNPNFGTLKGAINIPIQELGRRLAELEIYRKKEILVFCSHSHRSPQAAYLLNQEGFHNVVNMSGGMSVLQDAACKK
jgi:rhodanese-related sulfurtransferase